MKKGEGYWLDQHKEKALEFLNGTITEVELMKYHIENPSTYIFTLRALLQMGMPYLSDFLMKLSTKENRRIFLIDPDYLGLNYQELQDILVVTSKKLNKFRYSENATGEYGFFFIAHLAIICRVPLHWLILDEVKPRYEDDHLLYFPNSTFNNKDFIKYLKLVSASTKRDVAGVRLIIDGYDLCLRIEANYGQVLIEVLNGIKNEESKTVLEKLLEPYLPLSGMMQSVVPGREHYGYIIRNGNKLLTKPLYFMCEMPDGSTEI